MKKTRHLDIRMFENELGWFGKYAKRKNSTMSQIVLDFIRKLRKKEKEYQIEQ